MAGRSRKDFECITTCYPLRDYEVRHACARSILLYPMILLAARKAMISLHGSGPSLSAYTRKTFFAQYGSNKPNTGNNSKAFSCKVLMFYDIMHYVFVNPVMDKNFASIFYCGRLSPQDYIPASILRKSTSGRHRPVSYPDGPMTTRYRFT